MKQSLKQLLKQSFVAFEYHQDEKFYPADYEYEGSVETGWVISRNQSHYLTLPRGYQLLKTLACGICSTDIARHQLPFPLPQITGHEVVALHNKQMVVVDINAAHKHLGDESDCTYCNNGLENHCPDRLTLGIDRLPGGFSPYILVPQYAIIPLPKNFDVKLASIIEPFAAALHAVETENIGEGDTVAIVGPRRLGSLLILALSLWREKNNINFIITAIVRTDHTKDLCVLAGADNVMNIAQAQSTNYDVVFDTSGSVSGFELALSVATRTVHVKSTNGKTAFGLHHLTEMVIDELSLITIKKEKLNQYLSSFTGKNIIIDEKISGVTQDECFSVVSESDLKNNIVAFDKADLIVASTIGFINSVVRNEAGQSLIKPRGLLVLVSDLMTDSSLMIALNKGVRINTSRCGDFNLAIQVLSSNIEAANEFLPAFVSKTYRADQLPEAFQKAKTDKALIKVLIEHRGKESRL